MKRAVLLTLLIGMPSCVVAFLFWTYTNQPPTISFGEWNAPADPVFPLDRTEPDAAPIRLRNDDLLHATDFVFTMGVGSGMDGLDVFRVDAEGNATYIFANRITHGHVTWWQSEFKVEPAMLRKLRKLLIEVDYVSLERAYHAAVADGNQWCIRVDAAGVTKKVYCNNYFPEAAEKLAKLIGRELLPMHEEEIKTARRIWESTASAAAAGLWN